MRARSALLGLALCASFASSAVATTWIVDVNGTGQFTNIPPAIAAAQDGDVIIVLPGNYSSFTLTKSLTIVGQGNVTAFGSVLAVNNIPAGNRAAVVNLRASGLSVTNCAGHVIVQDVLPASVGAPFSLGVTNSADVRLRGIVTGSATARPQLSRIELARCTIYGPGGGFLADGEIGLDSAGQNRLHMVGTAMIGGQGGESPGGSFAGDGAVALRTLNSDLVIFAEGEIYGGAGGDANPTVPGQPCYHTGDGAPAVWINAGTTFRYSSSMIMGGSSFDPVTCAPSPVYWATGSGTFDAATPRDPILDFVGTPMPGANVQFVVRAAPGSLARLNFGRAPILVTDGLALVERLAPTALVVDLGIVPPSGQISFSWIIPALPTGTLLVAQAENVLQGGELRRTNSVPVIVR
jgi:hypothetical protein